MGWRAWLQRFVPYLGRRQAEADLQEELRLHVELERERQRGAGLPEGDAHRAARRRLGNGTLIRERTRDVWAGVGSTTAGDAAARPALQAEGTTGGSLLLPVARKRVFLTGIEGSH